MARSKKKNEAKKRGKGGGKGGKGGGSSAVRRADSVAEVLEACADCSDFDVEAAAHAVHCAATRGRESGAAVKYSNSQQCGLSCCSVWSS